MQADDHLGAVAGDQAADRADPGADVGDPQQRVAAAWKAEQSLEAERQVEIAARVEAALRERVEP